jgi:hypothetical protein
MNETCKFCGLVKLILEDGNCNCDRYFWRRVETQSPNLGQEIVLLRGGIVYNKTFHAERYDNFLFWCRKNKKSLKMKKGDQWFPLPDKPNSKNSP